MIGKLLGSLVAPVTDLLAKRQERKAAEERAKAKLAMARQNGQQTLEMTDAEWETVSTGMQDSTWKDEYVTVSVVSIFNLVVIGGIASAFGYPEVLEGVRQSLVTFKEVGVDVGVLLTAAVFAALGLKLWRQK